MEKLKDYGMTMKPLVDKINEIIHEIDNIKNDLKTVFDHIENNKKNENTKFVKCSKCKTEYKMPISFLGTILCEDCCDPMMKPASKLDEASYINTKISRLNNYVNSEDYVICVYKTNSMGDYVEDIDDLILDVLNEQAIKIDDDLIEWLKYIKRNDFRFCDISNYHCGMADRLLKQLGLEEYNG